MGDAVRDRGSGSGVEQQRLVPDGPARVSGGPSAGLRRPKRGFPTPERGFPAPERGFPAARARWLRRLRATFRRLRAGVLGRPTQMLGQRWRVVLAAILLMMTGMLYVWGMHSRGWGDGREQARAARRQPPA